MPEKVYSVGALTRSIRNNLLANNARIAGVWIEGEVSGLKTYSSGMIMRLAFAIATIIDPDILIVDEILAVGDEKFQVKSRKRMMDLMNGGTTVLMVSHNMEQVRSMCTHAVWLDHGTVRMKGQVAEVCDAYQSFLQQ